MSQGGEVDDKQDHNDDDVDDAHEDQGKEKSLMNAAFKTHCTSLDYT